MSSSTPKRIKPRGTYLPARGWYCGCSPARPAVRRQSRQANADGDKYFLFCPVFEQTRKCGFFFWHHEVTDREDEEIALELAGTHEVERTKLEQQFREVKSKVHSTIGSLDTTPKRATEEIDQTTDDEQRSLSPPKRAKLQESPVFDGDVSEGPVMAIFATPPPRLREHGLITPPPKFNLRRSDMISTKLDESPGTRSRSLRSSGREAGADDGSRRSVWITVKAMEEAHTREVAELKGVIAQLRCENGRLRSGKGNQ